MTSIPKLIHYVWVGGKPLPRRFQKNIASWRRHNPGYQLKLWNESNIDLANPLIRNGLERREWANVANYLRLDAVMKHGGIYLDTDVYMLKSLDGLLEESCFFGFQTQRPEDFPVNNAVFGATPRHWFIEKLLTCFNEAHADNGRAGDTGPGLLSQLLVEENLPFCPTQHVRLRDITIYPYDVFYPFHWEDGFRKRCITPNTLAIHLWEPSWHHDNSGVIKTAVFDFLKSNPWLYHYAKGCYRDLRQALLP